MTKNNNLANLGNLVPRRLISLFKGVAMQMDKKLLLVVLVWLGSACAAIHAPQAHTISFNNPAELHEYLRWRPDRPPPFLVRIEADRVRDSRRTASQHLKGPCVLPPA